MKILMGIPAFRLPDAVCWSIDSVINTPAQVLVIDNAADQDVKNVLEKYGDKIKVISNSTNGFCNGAWNQILKYGIDNSFDVIGLGTDVILGPGWYPKVEEYLLKNTKDTCIPNIVTNPEDDLKEGTLVAENIAGALSFLTLEAAKLVYPIPVGLKHWFGDTYIFGKLRANGWRTVVLGSIKANHPWSQVTCRTPEAYRIIEEDKKEWDRLWETKEISYF
jgi:Glycosyl transferase family 2